MRSPAHRPLLVRLLGSLLLVAGAVLMALSTTGRGAAALGRVAPPSFPTAVGNAVCDATSPILHDPAAVAPAGRCPEEDEETETTTSCSTSHDESESGDRRHQEDPGHAAATATATESSGRGPSTARTTTSSATTESGGRGLAPAGTATSTATSVSPPTRAPGIRGAGTAPGTGIAAATANATPTRAPVTTIPVTGASAPFGLGLALGIAGLTLLGVSSRRRR
jgi:hypothetical protein